MNRTTSSFEAVSFEEWQKAAELSLKGKALTSIETKTVEGMTLKPLYSDRPESIEQQLEWVRRSLQSERVNVSVPLTTVDVDVRPVHQQGGDAKTELVAFLLECHHYIESKNNVPTSVAFSVDTHFFMEIAKLRAARVLWERFLRAHQQSEKPLSFYAETSLRSFSLYDPHVNLLRSANSAFSAILGGVNQLYVYPFDVLTGPSTLGKRMAENIFEVIKEETFVHVVEDPSGGAYAIEHLTHELSESAWSLFSDLVDVSNEEQQQWLDNRSEEAFVSMMDDTAKRKHSLIGTTVYANPQENVQEATYDCAYQRLAEPFEQLRASLQQYSDQVAIIQSGDFKSSKPRVDFMKGFLSTFGWNPVVLSTETDLKAQLQEHDFKYIVVAGTDEDSAALLTAYDFSNYEVDVAGKDIRLGTSLLDQGMKYKKLFAGQEGQA